MIVYMIYATLAVSIAAIYYTEFRPNREEIAPLDTKP